MDPSWRDIWDRGNINYEVADLSKEVILVCVLYIVRISALTISRVNLHRDIPIVLPNHLECMDCYQ